VTRLDGHAIVVTGAGGGLGRAYALLLASHGAQVVVNDLGVTRDGSGSDAASADGVVSEIRAAGGSAIASYDNISSEAGAAALVGAAIDQFGKIDGVVNNAGILRDTSFHKITADDFDAVLKVHLYGSFFVTRAAWPHMRDQGFGRIVVATSTSGLYGNFGQSNYGAAKLGLVGLINTLAVEGAKFDVRANAVAPMAATRMTSDIAPKEILDKLPPEHVAPVVGYLMSRQCRDSGNIYVAGGGLVQRVALFQNEGVRFASPPTVDDLARRWAEISDLGAVVIAANPIG
jgi:NAD(P)-dependent dehydrogenase (short-subunit alcohol dehydrogenase family)